VAGQEPYPGEEKAMTDEERAELRLALAQIRALRDEVSKLYLSVEQSQAQLVEHTAEIAALRSELEGHSDEIRLLNYHPELED
jgi:predicted RNase H-like nuclease (RuvC/YqgF family)